MLTRTTHPKLSILARRALTLLFCLVFTIPVSFFSPGLRTARVLLNTEEHEEKGSEGKVAEAESLYSETQKARRLPRTVPTTRHTKVHSALPHIAAAPAHVETLRDKHNGCGAPLRC